MEGEPRTMFVHGVLLSASLLAFASAPWWVVPIGAVLLLFEHRDGTTAAPHRSSSSNSPYQAIFSIGMRLTRNSAFVALSFGLGEAAAWLFGAGSK